MSNWPEVSSKQPCPACGKPDRCRVSPDQNACVCFRESAPPDGWTVKKKHGSGATFIRERQHAATTAQSAPSSTSIMAPREEHAGSHTAPLLARLAPEQLNTAYRALLKQIPLTALHCSSLVRRGLTREQIAAGMFRSMPSFGDSRGALARKLFETLGEVIFKAVPGLGFDDAGRPTIFSGDGLLVPIFDHNQQIVAIKVRMDRSQNGQRYYTLSSRKHGGCSPGTPCHVPLGIAAPSPVIRITEGELKSTVAFALSGVPTISFPGVSLWRAALPVIKQLEATTVRCAFDMDAASNKEVAGNQLECIRHLANAGYSVEIERWAPSIAKGIDDALLAKAPVEILTGEDALRAAEEIALQAGLRINEGEQSVFQPPTNEERELVDRLQKVLATGDKTQLFADKELLKAIAGQAPIDRPFFSRLRTMAREAGISVREFDFATRKLVEDAAKEQSPTIARGDSGGYFESAGCICREKHSIDGPRTIPLCNFVADIVEEVVRDDGVERRTTLALEGRLSSEFSTGHDLPRVEVPADRFATMEWVVSMWGSDCVIYPGEVRNLAAAIQLRSQTGREASKKRKKRREIYEHTGLRKLEGLWDHDWVYLHAGGMIAPKKCEVDESTVSVELHGALKNYRLPAPPVGNDLATAVRASLGVLMAAPGRVMYPLLAAVYRVVLGSVDFGISLVGSSGVGKSEVAALIQQHFGPEFDARNLPANWSSTENALENLGSQAANAILVIDDFAPTGSGNDVTRYHQKADRLFRAQGNNAGRQRMRSDGSLIPAKPPRGLILSTGEDFPRGQSLRARMLILEVSKGDIDFRNGPLTQLQQHAAAGLYAASLAGYLEWILPQLDAVHEALKKEVPLLRAQATTERQHARTPGIIAELSFGFTLFLAFALKVKAISDEECGQLQREGWNALLASADAQQTYQTSNDPAKLFLGLLHSALGTGRVHLASVSGDGPPPDPLSCGWAHMAAGGSTDLRPQGKCVGWRDDSFIYLDREAAYAEIQKYRQEQGQSIPVSAAKTWKTIEEQNLLAVTDKERSTLAVRRQIQGKRRSVLCLLPTTLESCSEDLPELPESLQAASVEDQQRPADVPERASSAVDKAEQNPHAEAAGQVEATEWSGNGQSQSGDLTAKDPEKSSTKSQLVGLVSSGAHKGEGETEEFIFAS